MEENEMTMQEMLREIDSHIKELESPDTSLEDSFNIYEKGMKLIKQCSDKIDRVEKKVMVLNDEGNLSEMEEAREPADDPE